MKTIVFDTENYVSGTMFMLGYIIIDSITKSYEYFSIIGEHWNGEKINKFLNDLYNADCIMGWNLSHDIECIQNNTGINLTPYMRKPTIDVMKLFHAISGTQYHVSLKTAEKVFRLNRTENVVKQTAKYWEAWKYQKDENALNDLMSYNMEDCMNPYMIYNEIEKRMNK